MSIVQWLPRGSAFEPAVIDNLNQIEPPSSEPDAKQELQELNERDQTVINTERDEISRLREDAFQIMQDIEACERRIATREKSIAARNRAISFLDDEAPDLDEMEQAIGDAVAEITVASKPSRPSKSKKKEGAVG
jgi:hypothetical protein